MSPVVVALMALAAVAAAFAALWLSGRRRRADEAAAEAERLRAALDQEKRSTEEKLALIAGARESLAEQFRSLAAQIVDERSSRFAAESKERLGEMLDPLRLQIGEFKKKVEDVYDKEAQGRASLLQEIRHLKDLNQKIGEDAIALTRALKGDAKVRGNWGELVLERVLEQSGLANGREYETQVRLHERCGGAQARYPDVIVHLPEGRDVVVDSKVSLVAFTEYTAAETDEERRAALKRHVDSVRAHVKGLSEKSYDDLAGISSLDFVVMCVPNEPALIAAAAEDAALIEDAFARRVALVGPSTLLLTLRMVASIWRTEHQNRHALEIAERGQLLYDKLVGFVEDLRRIGKQIDDARAAYDDAEGKLIAGTGNLVGQAKKLVELGVKAKKQMPRELSERSDEP
ncbi:MAG: DNA recombination protein RmuC [Proteobacteria bacterium]|nr:DNA recombination protein RmuC [Pseudomonadota bacterium]